MNEAQQAELAGIRAGKVYVAGHRGMVGSAIVRRLEAAGCRRLVSRAHDELDLTDQAQVHRFFETERPDYVFLAAAKVGGILANRDHPAQFIYENLAIAANVVHAAHRHSARRLLNLGSSCVYPREAPQPIREEALMIGALEPTNAAYAHAKIVAIKLCESYNREYGTDFRSLMPTNLYGPRDNFDLQHSHVVPALIRKFHEAKQGRAPAVEIWGTGRPRREFLHVDDLADACLSFMCLPAEALRAVTEPDRSHVNVGCGADLSIAELAAKIGRIVGFEGSISFNAHFPDGTPRKLLDVSRMQALGWSARKSLDEGLSDTYRWYLDNVAA
jgi:GDP-L-fucose synthase